MIIRSKIMPPSVPDAVTFRPRVVDRLADLIERRSVVCVYATAGSGKTTAVSQAVRGLDRPLAWLSVDATDAAPGRLLTYLEATLATTFPDVAGVVGAALAAGLSHVEAAGILAESLEGHATLLVLDDLERLAEAPAALSVVGAFLRYAPATVRVVLISRSELRLPSAELGPSPWEGKLGALPLVFEQVFD